MEFDNEHVENLFSRLYNGLKENIPDIILNGDFDQRYKGNINFSFSYVEGESLIMAVKDLAVSSG
jgi:cysteine desulfurase